jgi:hypothetical protein
MLYCTTRVTVVVCEAEPEVPVTVIVELPAGVPVLPPPEELLPPPPQPHTKRNTRTSELTARTGVRARRWGISVSINTDRMRAMQKRTSLDAGIDGKRLLVTMVERAVVVTVRVAVAAAPFGVTLVGDSEQVTAVGAPLQARLTAELKPPLGVTEIV